MIDKNIALLRSRLLSQVRTFFDKKDFLEVETPVIVPYENPDDNVENVSVTFSDFKGDHFGFFLHTSPEFFMKRLLWYGFEKIYQISKVFRDGELGDYHNIEFTMVEWYNTGKDYVSGMDETEMLVRECFFTAAYCGFQSDVKFDEKFWRITVEDLFHEFAGVKDVSDREELEYVSGKASYEEAFFYLLVDKVEPELSKVKVPVFIFDFPEEFSAMAKTDNRLAERFELYIKGLEIANGYTELVDYDSYRIKFRKKNQAMDVGFLELLKVRPLPECEGVALGFDRLLMSITGRDILSVINFPVEMLIREVRDWKSL